MASRVVKQPIISRNSRKYDPWDLMFKEEAVTDSGVYNAQTKIYDTFITLAKTWASNDVLSLFRQVFIHCVDSTESNLTPALYILLQAGNEEDFHYTLNRVCYILVNNWETARDQDAIIELIDVLTMATDLKTGNSPKLRKLRRWVTTFLESQAFRDLKLYTSRETQSSHWTHRYTSYLLTAQSLNQNNPDEQRLAANIASNEMRREFKRNLAMYTLQSDKSNYSTDTLKNPTLLGEHVLPLIRKILTKKGKFGCQDVANIFLAQSKNAKFKHFKRGLAEYIVFAIGSEEITKLLQTQISEYLETLYTHYDKRPVDDAILLRTANQMIDFLIMNRRGTPAPTMTLLLSKGYALTLAILLLKVIMISPKSRKYLEGKIGDLVSYYGELPEGECQWLIQFLEILNVTFTIYSDRGSTLGG
ncbi:MAG: hypothetical protein AAGD25_07650 [Cyanobacteria bacterium P01_F01_bin.150]